MSKYGIAGVHPRARKAFFTCNDQDQAGGIPKDSKRCALARAIKRRLVPGVSVEVGLTIIIFLKAGDIPLHDRRHVADMSNAFSISASASTTANVRARSALRSRSPRNFWPGGKHD